MSLTQYTTPTLVQYEVQAKNVFSSSSIPSLDAVNNWIDENSRIIDSWTNNYFGSVTVEDEYLDFDGRNVFSLPHSDILTITSLSYNKAGRGLVPEFVVLEEGQDKNYLLYKDLGEVEFLKPAGISATVNPVYSEGSKRIKVSYTYGYSEVPSQIQRLATLMTAKNVMQSLINKKSSLAEVKIGQIMVKPPTSFSIGYLKSLNDEVKMLKDSIGEGFKVFRFNRVYRR